MRGWWMISVLAVAGCGGEHVGLNPNYQFGSGDYGKYRAAREVALVTAAPNPQTIPITLPATAPTPAQIAGRDPVPVPATMGVRVRRAPVVTTIPPVATGPAAQLPQRTRTIITVPTTAAGAPNVVAAPTGVGSPTVVEAPGGVGAPTVIVPRSMQPQAGRVLPANPSDPL